MDSMYISHFLAMCMHVSLPSSRCCIGQLSIINMVLRKGSSLSYKLSSTTIAGAHAHPLPPPLHSRKARQMSTLLLLSSSHGCKPLEFKVGDRVMLKVSPWKGVVHFGKKGKLAPRYVGPFEILERVDPVAYRLRLPEELSGVHDMFHVSTLKKCLAYASLHVLLNEIKVDKTLRFIEEPVEILDREIKSLKRSKISLVKVLWDSKGSPEFTWEREDFMKSKYPQLFISRADESAN
ncbi:hypothetical protein Tco_0168710 [Tanacetum coccineum]